MRLAVAVAVAISLLAHARRRDVSGVAWSRDVARGDDDDVMLVAKRPRHSCISGGASPAAARYRIYFRSTTTSGHIWVSATIWVRATTSKAAWKDSSALPKQRG